MGGVDLEEEGEVWEGGVKKKIYYVVSGFVQGMSPIFHMATQLSKQPVTGCWLKGPANGRGEM